MSVSIRKMCTYRKTTALCIILLSFLSLDTMVYAAEKDPIIKPAKLFTTTEPLSLTISAPWREITRKEKYQGTYPAKMEFTDESGKVTSLNMTVQRRGKTRQTVCSFPPIKLRFDKPEVKGTSFRGQKSLKMVTHCQSNSRHAQLYILEMLAYRLYNIITDFSFRVQPLTVTYVDSDHGVRQGPEFAFLIEDNSDVAKRNGQKKLKTGRNRHTRLEAREANNLALFQYMIANLDWSVLNGPEKDACCHNTKLIGQDPAEDPVYAIPYDFDVAGLINAPYATPPAHIPATKVTQRIYRGFCIHNETMPDGRQRFLSNEEALLAVFRDESLLNSNVRKKALRFLGKFFKILKDEQKYQKNIIGKCRK